MLITRISPFSGKENSMDLPITEEQLKLYEGGLHIQHAFPHLDAAQREFIKTGITAEEWEEMFQDEADDV